jgi:hypothetical protein
MKPGIPIVTMTRADFPVSLPGLSVRFPKVDGKSRTEDLLEETLEHRRHGAEPQRIDHYDMVGLFNGGLRLLNGRRRSLVLPFAT